MQHEIDYPRYLIAFQASSPRVRWPGWKRPGLFFCSKAIGPNVPNVRVSAKLAILRREEARLNSKSWAKCPFGQVQPNATNVRRQKPRRLVSIHRNWSGPTWRAPSSRRPEYRSLCSSKGRISFGDAGTPRHSGATNSAQWVMSQPLSNSPMAALSDVNQSRSAASQKPNAPTS